MLAFSYRAMVEFHGKVRRDLIYGCGPSIMDINDP
jgi:hypothetical protein